MQEQEYGEGIYRESGQIYKGVITLSEHKLYLRSPSADIVQTYIPLEKIIWIKLAKSRLELFVRPGISLYYAASFSGAKKKIQSLTEELIQRRGFKKKFLQKVWVENTK